MPQSKVLAAHHLKCYVNGVLIGYIVGMNWNVGTEWSPRYELDSNLPKELVPGMNRVGGTFSVVRGRNSGGLEGLGLTTFAQKLLRQKYLTIELQDRVTEVVVFSAQQCQVTNQQWGASPKQLVIGTFSWVGIDFTNEAYQ